MNNVFKISVLGSMFLLSQTALSQVDEPMTEKPMTKVLLFKWKEGTSSQQKAEITGIFRLLVQEVDGMDSFEIKRVHANRFETGYFLRFNSAAAERNYQLHKKHRELAIIAPKLVEDFLEYHYWN